MGTDRRLKCKLVRVNTTSSGTNRNYSIVTVVSAETLEKMMAADGGIRNWMQRFLKIESGFDRLQSIIQSEKTRSNDFRDQLMQFGREIIDERAAKIAKEPSGHDGNRVYTWNLAVLTRVLFDCNYVITNAAVLLSKMVIWATRQSANIALNHSKRISENMTRVPLAAFYLSYVMYLCHWRKASGIRCLKNDIDGIASRAALAGAFAGVVIGTAILPGVGTAIGGIFGGITALCFYSVVVPSIFGNERSVKTTFQDRIWPAPRWKEWKDEEEDEAKRRRTRGRRRKKENNEKKKK